MSSNSKRREVLSWCAKTVAARVARHRTRICTSAQAAPGKWGLLYSTPYPSNVSETMAGARSLAKIARRPVQKGRRAYVCNFAGASESASAFAPSIKTRARSHLAYMEKGAGQEATVIYPRMIEISWMHCAQCRHGGRKLGVGLREFEHARCSRAAGTQHVPDDPRSPLPPSKLPMSHRRRLPL